ncbi:MAG: sensor histidine kinase [Gordonia sp. (in: high G+C Gram-positive bacteria)]
MSDNHAWAAPWRTVRWGFSAIWMLFLGYPLSAVVVSDHPTWVKLVGYLLLAAFAGIYLLSCVYLLGAVRQSRWGVVAFLTLSALTAGLVPIIAEDAFGAAPFLTVLAAMTFGLGWSLVAIAGVLIATVAVPDLIGAEADLSIVVILLAVGFTMLGIRLVTAREAERTRAQERQRALDAQLAVVAERERVARDVHDILGHSLTVITVKTELAGRLVDLDPARAKTEMAEVNHLARAALGEVRATVGRLRSPELPDVIAAAESALLAAGISGDLPSPSVPTRAATLFAWVLREAVTNVVRHSDATRCDVRIDESSITVSDNGSGMDVGDLGNGLRGLRERVDAAGGVLSVDSSSAGTTLRVALS